jgi:hypothetical protein
MHRSRFLAVLVGVALAASAHAASPTCTVKISGAASGSFKCKAEMYNRAGDLVRLRIKPVKLPASIGVFTGELEFVAVTAKGTKPTPVTVQKAKILLTNAAHVTFAAQQKSAEPGAITLGFREIDMSGDPHGAPPMKGAILTARMASSTPSDGEVKLEVKF